MSHERIAAAIAKRTGSGNDLDVPIMLFATAATLSAVIVGVAAYVNWAATQDPLISLLDPLQVVMR